MQNVNIRVVAKVKLATARVSVVLIVVFGEEVPEVEQN